MTWKGVVPAAVLAVAAGGVLYANRTWGRDRPPPFLVVDDGSSRASALVAPGVVVLGGMATLRVTAPFTLLRVTPLRTDPAVETVTTRALFWGLTGSRTASRYQRFSDNPAASCVVAWPLTGHGPTYPVENLSLRPGDATLSLVHYVRSLTSGNRSAYGHRIDYRTPDGHTGTVTGGGDHELLLEVAPAGTPPSDLSRCSGEFGEPYPGYPA